MINFHTALLFKTLIWFSLVYLFSPLNHARDIGHVKIRVQFMYHID